jgi:hypothetical protein
VSGRKSRNALPKGQILIIFGAALLALAVFMGLAIDAASLYLTHARLKRAVDSAAVSAANDFKSGKTLENMTEAAREVLMLHNVDMTSVDLHVYDCLTPNLDTLAPAFAAICPDTTIYSPKKLIWVDATQAAPLYFMQLIGFNQVPLTTNSIAEAAPVDLVIVIDVSESMGNQTPGFVNGNYDPGACNAANDCQPLLDAKTAAQALVDSLYEGYDKVAIVTYDSIANNHYLNDSNGKSLLLSDKFTDDPSTTTDDAYITVTDTIDAIQLYDDPPITKIWPAWYSRGFSPDYAGPVFNPINPDDRDGDGLDSDWVDECAADPNFALCCTLDADRWDDSKDPYGWGGVPCDDDNKLDAYDFNGDGVYTQADTDAANNWLADPKHHSLSINSTCTGCGMRSASNILKLYGRPNAVWVIVFLSDGSANITETHNTDAVLVPTQFPNGYCTSVMDADFKNDKTWQAPWCIDTNIAPDERYCIDADPLTCPPDSIPQVANPLNNHYTVYDFTLDMIDEAALTKFDGPEPRGNDIAIYSIALGGAGDQVYGVAVGEQLLRYMAAVGDDGDRTTDPCISTATKNDCGQYYFAPSGDRLLPIFEDIAGRIYTRITQ